MGKLENNCDPKIVSYYNNHNNDSFEYNCELCDNEECAHWIEFNEKNNCCKDIFRREP